MELHELHVAQLGAGPVGGGHAVAGGHGRIGRLAVDHAGAAAGQDRLLGPDQQLAAAAAATTRAPTQRALVRQQIDGEGVVPDRDVGRLAGAVDDGPHDLEAGGVAEGVDDAAMAVAALARQGQLAVFLVEVRAAADQVVDLLGRLAHHHLDDVAVAQAGAGGQRVLDVVLEAVLRRQHAGDAALGVGAVALLDAVLGDDQHVAGPAAPPGPPAGRRCRRR